MKILIRGILFIVVVGLGYYLYKVIDDPIKERVAYREWKKEMIEKMELIRNAQFAYKDVKGSFANNWDSLLYVVNNDKITLVKTIGDPNDTNIVAKRDTSYMAIKDSIFFRKIMVKNKTRYEKIENFDINSLQYVPKTKNKFKIEADTINQRGVSVFVFQITDTTTYKPKSLKAQKPFVLGSMTEVKYSGNWK